MTRAMYDRTVPSDGLTRDDVIGLRPALQLSMSLSVVVAEDADITAFKTRQSENAMKPTLRERLLSKAIINWETGCWEWTAYKRHDGYGEIGTKGHMRKAHRVAYELLVGPIPDGLQLDHLCRVRHCINPAHLEPVTPRENTLRSPIATSALNAIKTHCPSGHEYNVENTRIYRGGRRCRACNRIWHRKSSRVDRARKRAAAAT